MNFELVLPVLLPVLLLLIFTAVLLACSPRAVKWDCPLSIAASFFLYLSRSVSQCGAHFGYQIVRLFRTLYFYRFFCFHKACEPSSVYVPVNILPSTFNRSVATSVSSLINSSKQICIKTLLGHHADHRNPSDESGDWLIPPNWWMMSSIWNGHPNRTPPPPLLPSGCHPRLICTNLINTLTGTPGLLTEEAVAAAAATRARLRDAQTRGLACCPDGPLIALMVAGTGMMIALNLNTPSLSQTHKITLVRCRTHPPRNVFHFSGGAMR